VLADSRRQVLVYNCNDLGRRLPEESFGAGGHIAGAGAIASPVFGTLCEE